MGTDADLGLAKSFDPVDTLAASTLLLAVPASLRPLPLPINLWPSLGHPSLRNTRENSPSISSRQDSGAQHQREERCVLAVLHDPGQQQLTTNNNQVDDDVFRGSAFLSGAAAAIDLVSVTL